MSGTRRTGAACDAACNAHTTKKLWKAGLSALSGKTGASAWSFFVYLDVNTE